MPSVPRNKDHIDKLSAILEERDDFLLYRIRMNDHLIEFNNNIYIAVAPNVRIVPV